MLYACSTCLHRCALPIGNAPSLLNVDMCQLSETRLSNFWDNIGYGLPEYTCHALNISVRHKIIFIPQSIDPSISTDYAER